MAMRHYGVTGKVDVRRLRSPRIRQCVAWISKELSIHIATLNAWKKASLLHREGALVLEIDPEGWSAAQMVILALNSMLN